MVRSRSLGWLVVAWSCVALTGACDMFDESLLQRGHQNPPLTDGGGSPRDGGRDSGEAGADTGPTPECTDEVPTCVRPNAVTACVQDECLLVECTGVFVDCDGEADNGCEATLNSVEHCGICGAACALPNAAASCDEGKCKFAGCVPGFGDCDEDPGNGCEIALDTVSDCGACGTTCPALDNATPGCNDGMCGVGVCLGQFGDCDLQPENGCEQPLVTGEHCGGCGTPCAPANATGDCSGGSCAVVACTGEFVDCNGLAADGCEATLDSAEHCGACGAACQLPNAEVQLCSGNPLGCSVDHSCSGAGCTPGAPENGCAAGYGDCDGVAANGCETRLDTLRDCGACGVDCAVPNAINACIDGGCVTQGCEPGFGACESASCMSLASDPDHCGECGESCGGATPNCAGGRCTAQDCPAGMADCDGTGGCEASLDTPARCGLCDVSCGPYPHATAACTNGRCAIGSCDPGFRDCDGAVSNGCEVDIRTLAACGACNTPCALPFAEESCASGSCEIVQCEPGRADCDGEADNGCEVSLLLPDHCGDCDTDCRGRPNVQSAGCAEGECVFVCEPGYGDCDGAVANGCEASFTSSAHCGGCGNDCGALPNVRTATCSDAVCKDLTCDPGWGDCDGNPANGCERRIDTLSDCGACNAPCAPAHATGACVLGSCGVASCEPGYADCNGMPADGCEASLNAPETCGSCTNACAGGMDCSNGECVCTSDDQCAEGYGCCNNRCVLTHGACFPWPCIPGTDRLETNCGGCGMTCLLWCCLTP